MTEIVLSAQQIFSLGICVGASTMLVMTFAGLMIMAARSRSKDDRRR